MKSLFTTCRAIFGFVLALAGAVGLVVTFLPVINSAQWASRVPPELPANFYVFWYTTGTLLSLLLILLGYSLSRKTAGPRS